jgi:hypothetical protein
MEDRVELGHVFYKVIGFPFQFSFHQLLHVHLSCCYTRKRFVDVTGTD